MIVNHPTTFQSFVNVVPNHGHCLTQPANSLFRAMTAMGLFWSHFQCLTRCLTPDHLQCDVVILRRHLQKCKHVEIMHSGLSWIIITQEINLSKLCPIDTGGGECYLHQVMKLSQNIEKGSIHPPFQSPNQFETYGKQGATGLAYIQTNTAMGWHTRCISTW